MVLVYEKQNLQQHFSNNTLKAIRNEARRLKFIAETLKYHLLS